MEICISDSCFMRVQAAMLKLWLGVMLVGYATASYAAQAGYDESASGVDVLSLPLAYSITGAGIGVGRASGVDANDQLPDRFGFGKLPNSRPYLDLKKVAAWVASIRWHVAEEGNHASFSPRLRVESMDTLISIRPRNHSMTVEWHKNLD